jgi:flagellar hook-basal body complex protein FliE
MADPLRIDSLRKGPIEINATQMRTPSPRVSEGGRSFQETLTDAMTEVQRLQSEADTTTKQLVAGELKDVSEVMVAVEKADVAFQTMMTVRNKVMTAYEEIMRMQV